MDRQERAAGVLAAVKDELDACAVAQCAAWRQRPSSEAEHAAQKAALADSYTREAACWDKLSHWVYRAGAAALPGLGFLVFGPAVIAAKARAVEHARTYRECARSAAERAARKAVAA